MRRKGPAWHCLVVVLCASLTLGLVGPLQPADAQETDYEERVAQITAGLDQLNSELDHGAFDVAIKAQDLAYDPQRMFSFVRDEIIFEPYVGALRGASATLEAGAGNALDQSLLLAALLGQAGYQTKIVQGTLDDADITVLLEQFLQTPTSPPAEPISQVQWQAFLETIMAGDTAALAAQDNEVAVADDAALDFWDRVDAIDAGLDDLVPTAAGTPQDLHALAALHHWVRYLDEAGTWVDLDPALPGAAFGATPVAAGTELDVVPDALWHTVAIVATVHVVDAEGNVEQKIVLDETVRTADVAGRELAFRNLPDVDAAPAGGDLEAWLAGISEFTATLTVDGQMLVGKSFDLRGDVFDAPSGIAEEMAETTGESLGGASDVLGGLSDLIGGEESTAPEPTGTRLVGERLRFEISAPTASGEPEVTVYERDIAPPETVELWRPDGAVTANASPDRTALVAALLTEYSVMPVTGRTSQVRSVALEIDAMRAFVPVFTAFSEALANNTAPNLPEDALRDDDAPIEALGLALDTDILVAQAIAARWPDARLWRGSAGLYSHWNGYALSGGDVSRSQGYDIVHNPVRAVGAGNGMAMPEVVRLAGIITTVLESDLLRPPSSVPVAAAIGAPEVFAAAAQQAIATVTIDPGQQERLAELDLPEPVKADLARDLDRGYVVVVPASAPLLGETTAIAWWRTNPDSGATLGMLPGGRGAAGTEDLLTIVINNLTNKEAAIFYAEMMMGLVIGVACYIDSDALNTNASTAVQVHDALLCIAVGFLAAYGSAGPSRHARAVLVASAVAVSLIAASNRAWQ